MANTWRGQKKKKEKITLVTYRILGNIGLNAKDPNSTLYSYTIDKLIVFFVYTNGNIMHRPDFESVVQQYSNIA